MSNLSGYTKVLSLGHAYIRDLLHGEVVIQEKVDGSQISFGVDKEGNLGVRSKNRALDIDDPDKMFADGVASIKARRALLPPGWIFRGEYLQRPKHNVLAYDSTPLGHIIIWDIETAPGAFLSPKEMQAEAARINFQAVPTFFEGILEVPDCVAYFNELLKNMSCLGGPCIEGVVIKNYAKATPWGGLAAGKVVSADFKEAHKAEWKSGVTKEGAIEMLVAQYSTEARLRKGVQHLRDDGKLTETPGDIGALLKAVAKDVHDECAEEIKQQLFDHFWPQISRGITRKIPNWYKKVLMEGV